MNVACVSIHEIPFHISVSLPIDFTRGVVAELPFYFLCIGSPFSIRLVSFARTHIDVAITINMWFPSLLVIVGYFLFPLLPPPPIPLSLYVCARESLRAWKYVRVLTLLLLQSCIYFSLTSFLLTHWICNHVCTHWHFLINSSVSWQALVMFSRKLQAPLQWPVHHH